MDLRLRNFYLESQVKNASPGQLLIMLYDGLVDNTERVEAALSQPTGSGDAFETSQCVSRCINILTELNSNLRPEEDPDLCATLRNLYIFFAKEFSEAFEQRSPSRVRAILPLIRSLRSSWSEAYRRAGHANSQVALV